MNVILLIVLVLLIIFVFYQFYIKNRFFDKKSDLSYANEKDPYDMPFILNNFISRDTCRKIIDYARDKLFDSEVVGGKYTDIRNSKQCWIPKNHELARPIFEFVSKKFNIPFKNGEDLQVVKYSPGQYFNEHHDACCEKNDKCQEFVERGGQRILTVLIYLNDDFENGSTYFKNLDIKIKLDPGNAIVFRPLAKNTNKCHPYALHAGMPVTRGEKWVANLWFREREFI